MPREVPEWVGRTPDSDPPKRVKDRIVKRQLGRCAGCNEQFGAARQPEFDHCHAIINGGENRETNIQALCPFCHAPKTKVDVAIKSKDARVRGKHLGLEAKRSSFPTARKGKWKSKIGGGVVRRED
jgi:5-methylcytosine-specific restriction protein A